MIRSAYQGVEGTYGRMESDNFVACFPAELLKGSREFVRSGEITYMNEGTEYHFRLVMALSCERQKYQHCFYGGQKQDCYGHGKN